MMNAKKSNISDSGETIFEQRIHPLDKLIHEKRMPILFVGSGITKRYLDTCTWKSLLENVALYAKIDKFRLNGIETKLRIEYPSEAINPLLASELSKKFMSDISSGEINRSSFPDISDFDWKEMEDHNPFKVLICRELKKKSLTTDVKLLQELETFKKLAIKIPAVITTNYDDFLETIVFQDFLVLKNSDDYYFSSLDCYGNILKIHGSIDNPDSIILTKEDYIGFKNNSKIITARLIHLLCTHPIIFIGCSLNDEDIKEILTDLVLSLSQEKLERIKNHIISVNVNPELHKSIWNVKYISHDGKNVEIFQLDIPNLEVLFRYLDRFTPVATPSEIRKYKNMIHEIVLSTDSHSKPVMLVHEDDTDNVNPKDYAVIFGTQDMISSLVKGITGYEILDAVLDVLIGRVGMLENSSAAFLTWLNEPRICNQSIKYIPVFYYLKKFGIKYTELPEKIVTLIENVIKNINKKIELIKDKCVEIDSEEKIDKFLNSQNQSFPTGDALMYFQHIGLLDREKCRSKLLTIYDTNLDNKSSKVKTDMRCAVTHLDMDEYLKTITT